MVWVNRVASVGATIANEVLSLSGRLAENGYHLSYVLSKELTVLEERVEIQGRKLAVNLRVEKISCSEEDGDESNSSETEE